MRRALRWLGLGGLAAVAARARLDGKVYLAASRVDDPATLKRVAPIFAAKYPETDGSSLGTRDWLFALRPR